MGKNVQKIQKKIWKKNWPKISQNEQKMSQKIGEKNWRKKIRFPENTMRKSKKMAKKHPKIGLRF